MTDLRPLLRLRALRETRAALAATLADARSEAARAAGVEAAEAVARHDRRAAARDAALHDAMIARGFTMADLTDADIRARHASHRREGLDAARLAALRTAEDAQAEAELHRQTLHRAVRAHEKLRLAMPRTKDEDADD
ncbi:hypothetical protein QCN27_06915 [Cereibacter sp. SYSU M97828]|nr:hypothetical protein [Cereibacter flavus]